MAKKSKTVKAEEPCAMDIIADIKMNITSNPSAEYSYCAFGADFVNWKNYINDDLEKMKKEFYPRIGTILKDHEGNSYRFIDIRLTSRKTKDAEIPVYVFDLETIQK